MRLGCLLVLSWRLTVRRCLILGCSTRAALPVQAAPSFLLHPRTEMAAFASGLMESFILNRVRTYPGRASTCAVGSSLLPEVRRKRCGTSSYHFEGKRRTAFRPLFTFSTE